jgi:hypothetical protein
MPLQTGATALKTVTLTSALLPFLWGLWPFLVIFLMLNKARKRRADDLVFTEEGIEVRGGARDGLAFAWSEIDPASVQIEATNEVFTRDRDEPVRYIQRLVIGDVSLGESGELNETASLAVVQAAIVARVAPEVAPSPHANDVLVALCPSCGAPIVPADEDRVTCARCAALIPMPNELRQRLQNAHNETLARADIEKKIRKVLARGSSANANVAITFYAMAVHLAVVPFIVLAIELRSPKWLLFAPGMALFSWGVAKMAVARRRALRDLTCDWGALESRDHSRPPVCRNCFAPLPRVLSEDVVVRCVYCGSVNVFGVGLGIGAARDASGSDSVGRAADITDVLRAQRAETAWAIGTGTIGFGLAALGVWLLAR